MMSRYMFCVVVVTVKRESLAGGKFGKSNLFEHLARESLAK